MGDLLESTDTSIKSTIFLELVLEKLFLVEISVFPFIKTDLSMEGMSSLTKSNFTAVSLPVKLFIKVGKIFDISVMLIALALETTEDVS